MKYIKLALIVSTIISISLFLFTDSTAEKFYFLHHRFFEFTVGGMAAIYFKPKSFTNQSLINSFLIISAICGLIIILAPTSGFNSVKVILITLFTSIVLIIGRKTNYKNWYYYLFENKTVVTIGKISFSIYMMHQVIFAFSRYAFVEEITPLWALILIVLTIGVSFITYHFIENPFRNPNVWPIRKVFFIIVPVFLISSMVSLHIYSIGGIIKDFPELNVYKNKTNLERKLFKITTNIHIQYNEDVRQLDKDFEENDQLKVLVIGNSYGRDFTNILQESEFSINLQIRYIDVARVLYDRSVIERVEGADKIFFAAYGLMGKDFINDIEKAHNFKIDNSKIWTAGIKNFGQHNGIHYNNVSNTTNFENYRTKINENVLEMNEVLKNEWDCRYIDLVEVTANELGEVLVFTPDGKFISPDTGHLTKAGAQYYAQHLNNILTTIIFSLQS